MYGVHLINKDGCNFDNTRVATRRDARSWATGRGGDYVCVLDDRNGDVVETWKYRNGRKVKEGMV